VSAAVFIQRYNSDVGPTNHGSIKQPLSNIRVNKVRLRWSGSSANFSLDFLGFEKEMKVAPGNPTSVLNADYSITRVNVFCLGLVMVWGGFYNAWNPALGAGLGGCLVAIHGIAPSSKQYCSLTDLCRDLAEEEKMKSLSAT
jgi:hypothetical protein